MIEKDKVYPPELLDRIEKHMHRVDRDTSRRLTYRDLAVAALEALGGFGLGGDVPSLVQALASVLKEIDHSQGMTHLVNESPVSISLWVDDSFLAGSERT